MPQPMAPPARSECMLPGRLNSKASWRIGRALIESSTITVSSGAAPRQLAHHAQRRHGTARAALPEGHLRGGAFGRRFGPDAFGTVTGGFTSG